MTSSKDPHVLAWGDQFGALVRDKCRQMLTAIAVTNWDTCAHGFQDPADGDHWRIAYEGNEFYLSNITSGDGEMVVLDLEALGVLR